MGWQVKTIWECRAEENGKSNASLTPFGCHAFCSTEETNHVPASTNAPGLDGTLQYSRESLLGHQDRHIVSTQFRPCQLVVLFKPADTDVTVLAKIVRSPRYSLWASGSRLGRVKYPRPQSLRDICNGIRRRLWLKPLRIWSSILSYPGSFISKINDPSSGILAKRSMWSFSFGLAPRRRNQVSILSTSSLCARLRF